MRKLELLSVLAALAIATPAMAQGRGRGNGGIPRGQRPSAGLCRIWLDGVPPGQQPAPTDCATAQLRVPRNGRIIYGGGPRSNRHFDANRRNGTNNGQNCAQRPDLNGVLRIWCDARNGNDQGRVNREDERRNGRMDREDEDRNDRMDREDNRGNGRWNRRDDRGDDGDGNGRIWKKGKKHKGDDGGDDDGGDA